LTGFFYFLSETRRSIKRNLAKLNEISRNLAKHGESNVFQDYSRKKIFVYSRLVHATALRNFGFSEVACVSLISRNTARSSEMENREMENVELLTKDQICKMLQISPRTLDLWRSRYGLPTVKLGNVCRFKRGAVLEFVMQFQKSRKGEQNA